jgi:hypothetical protein
MTASCLDRTTSAIALGPWHLFVIWPPVSRGQPLSTVQKKGEMAEWLKARAWKVRIPVKGYRGFESLSLRHGMTSGEAAGSSAMATSRACSSEGTALMTQGRNGRGHGMKPSLTGKPDRREVNPVDHKMATSRACSSEGTASAALLQDHLN